ncbi:MAG: ABC transporter substrate-binding protein, partial [Thermoguttaceae bacterium]
KVRVLVGALTLLMRGFIFFLLLTFWREPVSSWIKRFLSWTTGVLLLVLIGYLFWGTDSGDDSSSSNGAHDELRLVSTAPSITEILCALGLTERIVGISNYCHYPPEIEDLPRIGSLYEFDTERIIELKPDCVVLLAENEILAKSLSELGIPYVCVEHSSLKGVLDSFIILGKKASDFEKDDGILERAQTQRNHMLEEFEFIREKTANMEKRRTLISIFRELHKEGLGEIYVAGDNPYFNELLEIAGGVNVAQELEGIAPIVTAEGVIELNPEVIIDMRPPEKIATDYGLKEKETRADWDSLKTGVDAVRLNQVYPIWDDYASCPGPRSIYFARWLADVIHEHDVAN